MECKLVLELISSNSGEWCCTCDSFDFGNEPNYAYGSSPEECLKNFSQQVFSLETLTKRSRIKTLEQFKREVNVIKKILKNPQSSGEARYLGIEDLWSLKEEIEEDIKKHKKVLDLENLGDIKVSIQKHIEELQEIITTIIQIKDGWKKHFIQEVNHG